VGEPVNFDPHAKPFAREKALDRFVAELSADTRQILCGPWRSEVGFECLYWVPFLAHLAKRVPKFAERAAIVTRGGLAPLYSQIASQGFDLYALRSVTDVRRENAYDQKVRQAGKTQKQLVMTDWDENVLADAAHELGVAGSLYHIIHPAWMYWALAPFWEEEVGLKYLTKNALYQMLPKLTMDGAELPPSFVAMKWYGRATFPYPHPEVAEFVQHVVAVVSQQAPVLMLHGGPEHDDHIDIPVTGPHIHWLPQNLKPEDNLKIQAAVLSKATAFVGTYGGFAQLALRMGIPSVSFYHAQWGGTAHQHLALSSWLSKMSNVPFCVGNIPDAGLWQQVLSGPIKAVTQAAAA
jgi:hypothetical protein